MRKLFLALLCLLPLLSWADDFIIDETKSDIYIYFANGVLTDKEMQLNFNQSFRFKRNGI